VFYLLVAYAAIGAVGAQPGGTLAMSKEPLAFVLRTIGHGRVGDLVAGAAIVALPSVVLMMIYGQTRILFTMARDGLMPKFFADVHPKFFTPHKVTIVTGLFVSLFAGMFPVRALADVSNSGTLFAFFMVALGVLILRRTQPNRKRPFKTPLVWVVGPGAMAGSAFLFYSLDEVTLWWFTGWAITGLIVYYVYARSRSALAPGNMELPGKLEAAPIFHEGPEPGP
jgi:APA family basic amino acid/polyamine antiporter